MPICSYNKIGGRNNVVVAIRYRLWNGHLQPMASTKENGKIRNVKATMKIQP